LIDELEVELQIMQLFGMKSFIDGKFGSTSMTFWDWHGYMTNTYSTFIHLRIINLVRAQSERS